MSNVRVLCTASTSSLAEEISGVLGLPLSKVIATHVDADDESRIQIAENVRGRDVFLVQSMGAPVNNNTIELFLILTALRRASARRVYAVIPYFGYARQTKKTASRVPISAADMSKARLPESNLSLRCHGAAYLTAACAPHSFSKRVQWSTTSSLSISFVSRSI